MKLKEPKFLDYTKQKPQVNSVLLTSLVVVMFYQNIYRILNRTPKPHTYLFFTDIKDISRKLK